LSQIKRAIAEEYDIISWILRIFLGGAFNIIFLNALWEFITAYFYISDGVLYIRNILFTSPILSQFIELLILVFVTPFLASLFLTKRKPKLRIVPPCYITLVTMSWIIIILYTTLKQEAIVIGLFGIVLMLVGYVEDKLVTSILGLTTERESIYFEHLLVFSTIDNVKARLSVPEIRDRLHLSDRIGGSVETGYIFHNRRGYDFVKRILLTKNKQFPDLTDVKIVYYEIGRYNLRVSPIFLEASRETSAYLKDVLSNREPSFYVDIVQSFANNLHDPLIDSIIDEMLGYYAKYKRLSYRDWTKIIAFLGVLVATVLLFIYDYSIYGVLTAIIDALFALSTFPDIVRRQG
jgi:hypothetical protein